MESILTLALLATLALGACAPSQLSPRPATDPASPVAKEGAAAAAPVRVADGEVTYACPMHPEVTSKEPSLCPKCNMKLVPKK